MRTQASLLSHYTKNEAPESSGPYQKIIFKPFPCDDNVNMTAQESLYEHVDAV